MVTQMANALQVARSFSVDDARQFRRQRPYENQRLDDVGKVLVWAGVARCQNGRGLFLFVGHVTDIPIDVPGLFNRIARLSSSLKQLGQRKAEPRIDSEISQ
jgi:hypothetical protein